jgi:molecular chaperone DnaK
MKKDAEAHADEDKKKRDMIDVKNTADTMIYTTEKMMKEVDEKKITVTDDEKKKVTDALAALKEVKDKDDLEAIKKASEELTNAAQTVGMKMYQQESSSAKASEDKQASGEKQEENNNNGPIEGEVVDDKK